VIWKGLETANLAVHIVWPLPVLIHTDQNVKRVEEWEFGQQSASETHKTVSWCISAEEDISDLGTSDLHIGAVEVVLETLWVILFNIYKTTVYCLV